MSEFTMMLGDYAIDWRIGYPLFALALVPIGWFAYLLFSKMAFSGEKSNKPQKKGSLPHMDEAIYNRS